MNKRTKFTQIPMRKRFQHHAGVEATDKKERFIPGMLLLKIILLKNRVDDNSGKPG